MAKQITIAAGDIRADALNFLIEHGAEIHGVLVTLPETARVERGQHGWDYSIGWEDEEGNLEEQFLEVEISLDVDDTSIRLRKS